MIILWGHLEHLKDRFYVLRAGMEEFEDDLVTSQDCEPLFSEQKNL